MTQRSANVKTLPLYILFIFWSQNKTLTTLLFHQSGFPATLSTTISQIRAHSPTTPPNNDSAKKANHSLQHLHTQTLRTSYIAKAGTLIFVSDGKRDAGSVTCTCASSRIEPVTKKSLFLALRGQEKLDTQIRTSSIRRLMYLARCSATRIVRLRATQLEFSSVSNLHNMSLLTNVSGSGTEKSPKICKHSKIRNDSQKLNIETCSMEKSHSNEKFGATASGFLSKDFQRSDFFPRVRPITLEGSVQVRNKKIQINRTQTHSLCNCASSACKAPCWQCRLTKSRILYNIYSK